MFAHTKEDVEAWLEVLRSVVPKGVPVTTSEEIALSWEGKGRWTAAPTTEDDDILYRVTAFPNGKTAGGQDGKTEKIKTAKKRQDVKWQNCKTTKQQNG